MIFSRRPHRTGDSLLAFLYAISTFILTIYGLNLLWLAVLYVNKSRLRKGEVPSPGSLPPMEDQWPIVTVQLPLYNESLVAERLIDTCAHLRYPIQNLEIQILDDSTDETVDIVAERTEYWRSKGLDIIHIHRKDREGYKAGALKNGLRLARGSLIAIFDADFVPPPTFLLSMVPHFSDPEIGMVQGRWGHINAAESLLTKIQAFGLDAHFALEQFVRNRAGYFMNFNGTAGIWRRICIEEGGNWHSDTLAEDLDLSYRAQLKGWKFLYNEDVEVPAELPFNIAALRTQQFRWTKGAAEAAIKLLRTLWRSQLPIDMKVEGTFHLTGHFVFPFVLIVALLHSPLLLLEHIGVEGPSELYFGLLGIGLLGFVGFFLAQLFAQRALYPNWVRRVCFFPLFMAGTMGMALSNTGALFQAIRGKKTAFVRTPKYNTTFQPAQAAPAVVKQNKPQKRNIPFVVWLEAALAVYCTVGLFFIIVYGEWAAVPFQALFALGFGLVTVFNIQHITAPVK